MPNNAGNAAAPAAAVDDGRRLHKLPWSFKGGPDEDIKSFLRNVDKTCNSAGVEDDAKVDLMGLALQGPAAAWLANLEASAEFNATAKAKLASPEAFRDALTARFSTKKSPDALATMIKTLTMNKGESIKSFWDRCYTASLELNFRRTAAQKNTDLFREMQCEFMTVHGIGGLPAAVKSALPAVPDNISIEDLEQWFISAYDKATRDGVVIGGASGAAATAVAAGASKVKVEVASLEMSDQVAGLTKTFVKWANNLEKKNALHQNATFSVGQAVSGKAQPAPEVAAMGFGGAAPQRGGGGGRGRGRGSGRGGTSAGSQGTVPGNKCHRCGQEGHWSRDCPTPVSALPGRGGGNSGGYPSQQPPFGVNTMTYANAAGQQQQQQPQQPPMYMMQPQQQQQGQAGPGSLFKTKWDYQGFP